MFDSASSLTHHCSRRALVDERIKYASLVCEQESERYLLQHTGRRLRVGRVVDLEGFEPSTSSMPLRRAPSCATGPHRRWRTCSSQPRNHSIA